MKKPGWGESLTANGAHRVIRLIALVSKYADFVKFDGSLKFPAHPNKTSHSIKKGEALPF